MNCATCKKEINGAPILAVDRSFCSDVCHLRFWKDELPNLGGRWISDEDIQRLQRLHGEEREEEYSRIVSFILNHLDSSPLMLNLRHSIEPEPQEEK